MENLKSEYPAFGPRFEPRTFQISKGGNHLAKMSGVGLELNSVNQVCVCGDDVNLLGENYSGILLQDNEETSLKGSINMYEHDTKSATSHNNFKSSVNVINISIVNTANKYKLVLDEIRRRINSENSCYYSVLKLLFSVSLIILYGCEMWSFTLWKGPKLQVFENKVLRKMFGM
jgi:hypothetical protein